MRQQVIHQEGHIPPSSRNGRNVDDNTHSRITNGSQNGNNRFGGGYDCTDEAQHKKASLNGKNVITSSFYQPTKTQIISGNTPTLERVTQIHTSHIQHANNNSLHASKGKKYVFSIVRMIPVITNKTLLPFVRSFNPFILSCIVSICQKYNALKWQNENGVIIS